MSVEEHILEAVCSLPAGQQPFQSVKGLWAGLGVDLSAEDIDANQAEIWRNFPSDDL